MHSLKDVPTKLVPGCVVRAVGAREDPRDVLVMRAGRAEGGVTTLQGLLDTTTGGGGGGGVVGTSSVRRAAMIRRRYPGLRIKDVRGNVGTRLRKLDAAGESSSSSEYDCLVLAGAGVLRLGLGDRISSWVGREEGMLHAVGQGALGVEFREGDGWVAGLLAAVEDGGGGRKKVGWACAAERMLLACLEGGCSVPVGVETDWEEADDWEDEDAKPDDNDDDEHGGILVMRAMVLAVDGSECVEGERRQRVSSDAAAEECGFEMARDLMARGATAILEKITLNRGAA